MKHLLSFAFLTFLVSNALGQTTTVTAEPFFNGATLTAVDLPLPKAGANGWGMSGVISVGIIVNELGSVSVTDDGEGPYPVCTKVTDTRVLDLRAAAVEAAKNAKFSPLVIDGQPRMVSGRLNYSFGSGKSMGVAGLGATDTMTMLGTTDQTVGAKIEGTGTARVVNEDGKLQTSSGVLNGKATALAKPAYPAAAKAVRAGGTVSVQVVIYEDGTMYSATAISGHPLLRRSSEIAACSSRFSPTLLEGNPVKVSGVITYNYVP